ncbi:hypothetical protein B0H14DRAFT_2295293, partial [Mycena olivaceomarginata]
MSSVWSVFGLVGALRAHLKIAASIAGSERAGVDLFGAATYTARQTMSSMCYWKVGRTNRPLMWRDSTNQLLSRLDTTGSPWIRPICIALGYSRCPWGPTARRCVWEVLSLFWSMFTMAIAILPTLILMPNLRELSTIQKITVAVQVATAGSAGSLTPILLHRLNSVGLPHLIQLSPDRYMFAGLIKQGDHVVTSLPAGVCHIIWQTSPTEMAPRSGDYEALRILCSLNTVAILAAYLSNYIVLGAASGLAGVVPTDIILAEYTLVGSHYVPAGALIEVIRLPWSFVEELYLGQGIILGNSPWALGGMYLGAVICDGTFLGLTTLHPFA